VSDAGATARLLFVDHEADFADRSMGDTLEELLEDSVRQAREGDDEDSEDDDGEGSAQAPQTPSGARRFTSTEGGSSKFWEAAVEGTSLTVKFGKIGTAGQTKTKVFATEAAARTEMEKLVKEKVGKGYVEG